MSTGIKNEFGLYGEGNVTYVKYLKTTSSPQFQRLKGLLDIQHDLLNRPVEDDSLLDINRLQSAFFQNLRAAIAESNFPGSPDQETMVQNMLNGCAMYHLLVGSSAKLAEWEQMGTDIHKPNDLFEFCPQGEFGLLHASYFLNAQKLGIVGPEIGISTPLIALFDTIDNFAIPPLPPVSNPQN
jgi:hypothetical protein